MSLMNLVDQMSVESAPLFVRAGSPISSSPPALGRPRSNSNLDKGASGDSEDQSVYDDSTSLTLRPNGTKLAVKVPPPPNDYSEYPLRDERVVKVLRESDQKGHYLVVTRDGRRVTRDTDVISSDARGRQALQDFDHTILSDATSSDSPRQHRRRTTAAFSGGRGQLDGMSSESESDSSSKAPRKRGRLHLTFQRSTTPQKPLKTFGLFSEEETSDDAASSDGSITWQPRGKPRRGRQATRNTRVSNQPRIRYDFGQLSASEDEPPMTRRGKRKRQAEEPARRSGRTNNQGLRSMREMGEDDIEEIEVRKAAPKALGAKETFKRLPIDSKFRKRHCMICDTCGQMGDSSEKGNLIFCQGCTMAYHRVCIGHRTNRDHLVTKVGDEDFVLQCRRCVELAHYKDKTAPHQGRCASCKTMGMASKPFRLRKTPMQEQRDREMNGGVDPIQSVSGSLINNVENVLFRCQSCFQAFHLHHLDPRQENPLEGDDPSQKASSRFSEYSSTWTCHVCDSRPTPSLPHSHKANIGALIAWRPTQDAEYRSGQTVSEVAEDGKEYLVKWSNMSYYSCRWMPGWWVWGFSTAAMRKAFANRDGGRNLPTMRTEDAIPEDWLRIDIVFSVKYSNLVQAQIEEVDIARIKEVARVYAKFKGLTYEDSVWTDPPDIEESDRYEDFRSAYIDHIRGKYIRPPTQKKIANEIQKLKSKTDNERKAVFSARMMLKEQPADLLNGKLMDYQLEGVNWLLFQWQRERNAILADEMGLGKTIQVIGFLAALKENHGLWPFLIVVPNATCANWRREIKHWAPQMRVITYFGSEKAKSLAMDHELFGDRDKSGRHTSTDLRCHVVVTSYETASDPHCLPFFRRIAWQAVVVDEGQRLKNDKTILYSNLLSIKSPFRLLLTGTPLQNNQRELFNLLQFLDKDKNAAKLEEEYAELNQELIKQIHEMIRPYFLRRTKAQVLTFLPPMGQVIVPVTMSTLQKELYKNILSRNAPLLKAILSKRDNNEKGQSISGLRNILVQLRKCLCHPFVYNLEVEERTDNAAVSHRRLVAASPKLVLLELMLPKLRQQGHRILFFSQFLGMLTIMEDFLDGMELSYLRLDGSQSSLEKQKIIDSYNAPDSDIFVMLLSTRAGGVGINLASADTVIILDPDFNPHQDIQAIARAHRIGQNKKVLVLKLMTRDSAEERIMQVGKRKMILDHVIVDQMEAEDSGGNDLESILAFGAQALFNDEAKNIVYDDQSVEKLLDRSQIEDTKTGEGEESSQENAFSFARVWQNDGGGLGEMSVATEGGDNIDTGVWDKILATRAQEAEQERRKKEDDMGRGKRIRNIVNYGKDMVKNKDNDSDTDFAARSSEDEEPENNEDEQDNAAAKEAHSLQGNIEAPKPPRPSQQPSWPSSDYNAYLSKSPIPTTNIIADAGYVPGAYHASTRYPPVNVLPSSTTGHSPQPARTLQNATLSEQQPKFENLRIQPLTSLSTRPKQKFPVADASFTRATIRNFAPLEQNDDSLPCLACMDYWGPHVLGSCPLKVAGPEHCNLCGLAHFGYQRTCPHLKSETQVRWMLEALKNSPEDPELVRKARIKLQQLKGSLVQEKKRRAEQAASSAASLRKEQGIGPGTNTISPAQVRQAAKQIDGSPSVFQQGWSPLSDSWTAQRTTVTKGGPLHPGRAEGVERKETALTEQQ